MSVANRNRVFSSTAFRASKTGRPLIRQIGKHLDVLDGKPVQTEPGGFGIVHYEVDGEGYELYPVMPEWCEERKPMGAKAQNKEKR